MSEFDLRMSLVTAAVLREAHKASQLLPPLNSAHEAYAVILEELDEFKEEVWKKPALRIPGNMRKELIQCAGVCVRAILDLDLHQGEEL